MTMYKKHLDLKGFDDEEDLSDDEVFTRGGKSIPIEENGVSKPLMAPRQRTKDSLQTKVRKVPPPRVIWLPIMYFLITLGAIIGIICLVVFLINIFMRNIARGTNPNPFTTAHFLAPCSKIKAEDVWVKIFPMLTTETAIRLNDINSDSTEDIILGFGTGADAFRYPAVVCDVYFPDSKEGCGGGVLALDGKSGREIWRHYTLHEIFALNCNIDLNGDSVKDCIGGGRMAGFRAISGKNGHLLWDFNDKHAKVQTSNVYTPQYVKDLDHDNVPDLVVIHGGDPMREPGSHTRLVGRLMIVSGKTGRVLKWVEVPDKMESYYSPQILMHPDGTEVVLFGTGGETHGGSLWYITLKDLLTGQINMAKAIYTDDKKGIMTPPVLVDITGDGVLDIVMAMFNSTVVAFDGLTFSRIWIFHQVSSESYSTPGVGFFNNDSIPDFIINYQTGPGFPIYYYTQTTILDGRNGKPLLEKPVKMVVGTQSSPLVINVDGRGNDIFLYWISDCHGTENKTNLEFDFLKGTTIHEQSRADFCKLRFKEKLFTRMYALTSHHKPPGNVVYDSDKKRSVEYSYPINFTAVGLEFLYRHPEYQHQYKSLLEGENEQMPSANEIEENLSDFPDQYGNLRLQNLFSSQKGGDDDAYPYGNSPIVGDQNDYITADDQIEDAIYSPDYDSPQKYSVPENEPYNSVGYYGNGPEDSDIQYIRDRKLQRKKMSHWPTRLVDIPSQQGRQRPGIARNRVTSDSQRQPLKSYVDRQQIITPNDEWKDNARYTYGGSKLLRNHVHKRHVGPHDGGGVQRVISTGTLAPPLPSKGNRQGIDVVFATFWFFPSNTQGLLPEDKNCIEALMSKEEERFQTTSKFYGMDHDAYEEAITEECLKRTGNLKNYPHGKNSIGREYNPFDRPMGQMTIYRMHIDCGCSSNHQHPETVCTQILPFDKQGWTSYMGMYGNSVARLNESN